MRDARVGQLQVSLNVWISRNNVGLTPLWIDTVFGVRTAAAVRAFQSSAGLISDGIVGSRTWNELSKSGLLEFPPPDYP
ncbi:MAG: peptidoglycan-binding protein [Actinomycetota bacterium]|nr:peptidoglycan-binding protein [Actinomycetota bacterium]